MILLIQTFRKDETMFIVLLLLWIIFNGRITAEILIFGIVISFAICQLLSFITRRNCFVINKKMLKKMYFRLRYYAVLTVEIVKANIQVMDIILTPGDIEVEPVLTEFKSKIKQSSLNVLLANSITLTPGTITVDLDKDRFLVLGLDTSFVEGLDESVFVKELSKIEEQGLD